LALAVRVYRVSQAKLEKLQVVVVVVVVSSQGRQMGCELAARVVAGKANRDREDLGRCRIAARRLWCRWWCWWQVPPQANPWVARVQWVSTVQCDRPQEQWLHRN